MATRRGERLQRRCPNCGSPMTPSSVSCDVCGTVVGASAPLTSLGGIVEPPTQPQQPAPGTTSYGSPPPNGPAPGSPAYGSPPPTYGSPPPPPYGAPPPYGSVPGAIGPSPGYQPGWAPRTNPKAVWSLILAILGFFMCYLVGPILAIVLGGQARREIRHSGGVEQGDGMAQAGQILGWIGLGLTVLAVVAFTALVMLGRTASVKFSTISPEPDPSGYCVTHPYDPSC